MESNQDLSNFRGILRNSDFETLKRFDFSKIDVATDYASIRILSNKGNFEMMKYIFDIAKIHGKPFNFGTTEFINAFFSGARESNVDAFIKFLNDCTAKEVDEEIKMQVDEVKTEVKTEVKPEIKMQVDQVKTHVNSEELLKTDALFRHPAVISSMFVKAIEQGDVQKLKFLKEKGYEWVGDIRKLAAEHGHLNVIEWAEENGIKSTFFEYLAAATHGFVHILEWAKNRGVYLDINVAKAAAEAGQVETLKWLFVNNISINVLVISAVEKVILMYLNGPRK
jgi:hypothetical protein